MFSALASIDFNVAAFGTFQSQTLSFTHSYIGVYSDFCGPLKIDLVGTAVSAPYLTLTQPDLLEFAPSSGDAVGVHPHQIRVSLRDESSVFEDFDFSVEIIDCSVIDFYATEPQPDPPVSRVDLVQEVTYVVGVDATTVIPFEFGDYETNLNNGCESAFLIFHDILVEGSATIPAWIP